MDLDGDGHVDILSGSWPGELFLFRGGPGHTFAPPEMLQDKTGAYINIGGGITEERDGGILITGNADFEETPEGTFAVYHGKRMKTTADKPISITGTASAVHATDWDGDGDLDLVVGEIGGNVYLVPNEGTAKAYAFGKAEALLADGKAIRVDGGDAGPYVVDWDGDGKRDLLVGDGKGGVSLFRNVGDDKSPRLAAAEVLVEQVGWGGEVAKTPTRGTRAKVCVADWNGDGRLDLLLGDNADLKPDLPEPTAEQKLEHDKLHAELKALEGRYREITAKLFAVPRIKDEAKRKALKDDYSSVLEQMQAVRAKLPVESETHGWVWLFARRAADTGKPGQR